MASSSRLVACSACGEHAKRSEIDCPHCGARLRSADGSLPVTAVAVLMGLSTASCLQTAALYGGVCTTNCTYVGPSGAGGAAVDGGSDGTGGASGEGGGAADAAVDGDGGSDGGH